MNSNNPETYGELLALLKQTKQMKINERNPVINLDPTIEMLENAHGDEKTSDGYHTFEELYRYRLLYNAAFFNMLWKYTDIPVQKSKYHEDGTRPFGKNWFIVQAKLPTGYISNHYPDECWNMFSIPESALAWPYDGHTPKVAADRLEDWITHENFAHLITFPVNSKILLDTLDKIKSEVESVKSGNVRKKAEAYNDLDSAFHAFLQEQGDRVKVHPDEELPKSLDDISFHSMLEFCYWLFNKA